MPIERARISPLDRGFVFGDGVYEGLRAVAVDGGRGTHIVALGHHLDRMRRSLRECWIGFEPAALEQASYDLLAANALRDAFVYWQVTRGTPRLDAGDPARTRVPAPGMAPTVFGYCAPQPPLSAFAEPARRTAVTLEDVRWTLGHIKSTSLMGNVLLTMAADRAGAEEAIFLRHGLVAEGTATNVLVAVDGPRGAREVATPSLESVPILKGVTRSILLDAGCGIVERAVKAEELERASEIMVIGTTTMVASIVRLNGRPVGAGAPGPEARRLLKTLLSAIEGEAAADGGARGTAARRAAGA